MTSRKRKALGQHFLADRRILSKIVSQIDPQPQDLIIEIGAGKGSLTFLLAEKAGRVIAVEKDSALIPHLEVKKLPNLSILHEDILKVGLSSLIPGSQAKVAGNLPFSLSSPILFKILKEKELVSRCVFLLQKEVAERLCAKPGSKKYAPLSILFQNHFQAEVAFLVQPHSFSPPPQVESALVVLKKRGRPVFALEDEEAFGRFLRAAFQQRRKKLINNLKKMDTPLDLLPKVLLNCNIDPQARPEQVSLSQFVALFHLLQK